MVRPKLAVIGYGRLGQACAQAIKGDETLQLAGIVRRAEKCAEPLSSPWRDVPVVAHVSELKQVDAALICVPAEVVQGVAHDLLQHRIPVIECATLHGDAFVEHKRALDRMAMNHKVTAIVGAGWDPGALSLFRSLFALFCPHGHTELTRRPGINLHHSTLAGALPGVKAAMATEQRSQQGSRQNYLYLELEPGIDPAAMEAQLRRDPLFAGEELLIFPVESIAELEQQGHGVVLERRGSAAGVEHQLFLLEARFSEYALTAQVMVAATRVLGRVGKGAFTLLDLPAGALWGELRAPAEREWE